MSSTTTSAPAASSTNAIPNLHGGAHPATPKLAGIICGSSILFAWTVCLIYWWWNRRREKQDQAEAAANRKMRELDGSKGPPLRRGRSRGSQTFRRYPQEKATVRSDPRSAPMVSGGNATSSPTRPELPHVMSGPLTPMTEVPTKDEGSAIDMKVLSK